MDFFKSIQDLFTPPSAKPDQNSSGVAPSLPPKNHVNNNNNNGKGGVPVQFPERLYRMLMEVGENEQEEIVSWQPHGRCFIVHQPQKFLQEIIPK